MVRAARTRPVRSSGSPERPQVGAVAISHPSRVVFTEARATKLDLARYYQQVGEWMVPHVADRPLTLVRCPNGVGAGRKGVDCIFMRHSRVWGPEWLRRVRIREKTKIGDYLIADSVDALISLVQMGVVEVHTWNSTFSDVERPDRIVIDIDPGARVGWASVVDAARTVRAALQALELESFVKTTGGRGLHVVVPLKPRADWSACLSFARAIAEWMARTQPERFTTRFAKAGRDDRLLVDYLRNNRTNTSIAAFSTRATPRAPVSAPIAWSELASIEAPGRFSIRTMPTRLARLKADPWKRYWTISQVLPARAVAALERL